MKNRLCENFSLFFFLATLMVNLGCSNSSPSRKIASSTSPKPSWINQIPKKTGYKFYIGRSSNSYFEEDGINRATQDAYNQVIREDFGVETKIDIKSSETMKSVHYSKSFQEKSGKVRFKGFKRENFHVEKDNKDNDVFNVWILFRYSLKEMNKEKKRRSAITKEKKISKKNYALGRIEYEKGNHAKTRRLWKRACDAGNEKGCDGLIELAHKEKNTQMMALRPKGVTMNVSKAEKNIFKKKRYHKDYIAFFEYFIGLRTGKKGIGFNEEVYSKSIIHGSRLHIIGAKDFTFGIDYRIGKYKSESNLGFINVFDSRYFGLFAMTVFSIKRFRAIIFRGTWFFKHDHKSQSSMTIKGNGFSLGVGYMMIPVTINLEFSKYILDKVEESSGTTFPISSYTQGNKIKGTEVTVSLSIPFAIF